MLDALSKIARTTGIQGSSEHQQPGTTTLEMLAIENLMGVSKSIFTWGNDKSEQLEKQTAHYEKHQQYRSLFDQAVKEFNDHPKKGIQVGATRPCTGLTRSLCLAVLGVGGLADRQAQGRHAALHRRFSQEHRRAEQEDGG